MAAVRITGNVRDRFIQAAVLLHTLDPVRVNPRRTVLIKIHTRLSRQESG